MELLPGLFDSHFNGVDVLWLVLVVAMLAFARYATERGLRESRAAVAQVERARALRPPAVSFPLDPRLEMARRVRRSYDGLPYRRRAV